MAVQHDDDESTTFGNTPKQDDYESVNLLKEDYDDDESTIVDLQPKRIIQQETPSAASNASSQVSPMTQTLNALSQNMNDLRYSSNTNTSITVEQRQVKPSKPMKKNKAKEPTGRNQSTASNPNRLQWSDYKQDWERIPFFIPQESGEAGTLGMRIQNADFQGTGSSKRISKQCRIMSTFGLARKHGLQERDWVCHPLVTKNQDYIDLADFEQVQQWSKQRPFSVCILRPKHVKPTKKQTSKTPNDQPWLTSFHSKENGMSLQVDNDKKKKKNLEMRHDSGCSEEDDEETQLEPGKSLAKPLKVDKTTQAAASSLLSLQQQFQSGQRGFKDPLLTKKPKATKRASNLLTPGNNKNKSKESSSLKLSRAPTKKPKESSSLKLSRAPTKKTTTTKQTSSRFTYNQTSSTDSLPSSSKIKASTVVPFCLKCNTSSSNLIQPLKHHSWCPRNDFFENSGAKDIMKRIQHGRKNLNCQACQREYETGKLLSRSKHLETCNQFRKKLEELRKEEEAEEERKEAMKEKQKRRKFECLLSSSSSDEQGDSDDEVDDGSSYQPKRKKSKISVLSAGSAKQNGRPQYVSPTPKKSKFVSANQSRKAASKSTRDEQRGLFVPTTKTFQEKKVAQAKKVAGSGSTNPSRFNIRLSNDRKTLDGCILPKSKPRESQDGTFRKPSGTCPNGFTWDKQRGLYVPIMKASPTSASHIPPPQAVPVHNTDNEEPNHESLKPVWVNCPDMNPWGKPGYVDGDVQLYGPQSGIGHHEISSPSRRYTMEPFTPSSCYMNTHCTPQEGWVVLSLRRDPLSTLPWGFKVALDEFGHACLVQSVDPVSPAAVATFLATATNSEEDSPPALQVNDMILMVNGKEVGGMSEVGVELEIDTSGPKLNLVVSRYKHAKNVQKKFVEAERQMMRVMDSAARDDRLIGYLEIGNGISLQDSETGQQEHQSSVSGGLGQSMNSMEAEGESASLISPLKEGEVKEDACVADTDNCNMHRSEEDRRHSMTNPNISDKTEECPFELEYVGSQPSKSPSESGNKSDSDDSDSSASDKWNQDENTWNGCVCGKIHDERWKLFWIQCETCDSWYDVSEKCVGFSEQDAKKIKGWNCWACPSPQNDDSKEDDDHPEENVENHKVSDSVSTMSFPVNISNERMTQDGCILPKSKPREGQDGTFRKPPGPSPNGFTWDEQRGLFVPIMKASQGKHPPKKVPKSDKVSGSRKFSSAIPQGYGLRYKRKNGDQKIYATIQVGDRVEVTPHSWPGVNNLGGIGHVFKIERDEDGELYYSVKYIVHGFSEREIEAEYVSLHLFK